LVSGAQGWRGRRVLITGHTGFKGGWLALWLAARGAQVSGYALAPESSPSLFAAARLAERVDSCIGDVRDAAALQAAMRAARPQVVFHLAAQSLVRRSYLDPAGTFATNVTGTVHCLDAARACPSVQAVVVVTSDKCYENDGTPRRFREDDRLGGHDPYSASKAAAELAVAAYRRSFPGGARLATVRAGNVVGGGDWAQDRLVPDAVRAFAGGAALQLRNPAATRPWQHVLDPLAGYLRLAERLLASPDYAQAWNFGPAAATAERTVGWLADRLAERWGGGARWEAVDAAGPAEAERLGLDCTKASERLDWSPRLDMERMLDWTVEWYRRQAQGEDAAALSLEQVERYERLAA
jgi:CDP-glucose 4,6-dehydratase